MTAANTSTDGSKTTKGKTVKDQEPIDGTPNGPMAKAHKEAERKAKGNGKDKPDTKPADGDEPEQLALPTFDPDLVELMKSCYSELDAIDDERGELNAKRAEVVARMHNKGLSKKGIKAVRHYFSLDDGDRKIFDITYAYGRAVLGDPLGDDLFDAAIRNQLDEHLKSRKH